MVSLPHHDVATVQREAASFTFVAFGDAQNDIKTHGARVFREAFRVAYQIITIDGDEVRYAARTTTHRFSDAFTLKKRAGPPNQLLEPLRPASCGPATAGSTVFVYQPRPRHSRADTGAP